MWFSFMFVHQITVPGTLPTTARLVASCAGCPSLARGCAASRFLPNCGPPVSSGCSQSDPPCRERWEEREAVTTSSLTGGEMTHCLPRNTDCTGMQDNSLISVTRGGFDKVGGHEEWLCRLWLHAVCVRGKQASSRCGGWLKYADTAAQSKLIVWSDSGKTLFLFGMAGAESTVYCYWTSMLPITPELEEKWTNIQYRPLLYFIYLIFI